MRALDALFSALGADPTDWIGRNDEERLSQLHRFLFLRQAWRQIIADDDLEWIEREIANAKARRGEPFSGIGEALERLRAAGAEDADLTELVRGMQASLLFSLTYLLSDPAIDDGALEEWNLAELGWALVETDVEGNPTGRTIDLLHESVLATDPAGREMRPRRIG